MSVILAKKICFKMNVTLHFQYKFSFSSNFTLNKYFNFSLRNFQCNFNFVFFLQSKGSLVKALYPMIISFHFLISVSKPKATLILKRREYNLVCVREHSFKAWLIELKRR